MQKIKFIGLGMGVKRAKNPIDLEAAGRRIEEQTREKFDEYRKARIAAAAEARNRWFD